MTKFEKVYDSFFSKITDDMYMELTEEDTMKLTYGLLESAVHKFEFPRRSLQYDITMEVENPDFVEDIEESEMNPKTIKVGAFESDLTQEQINILSTYMVVGWIDRQLASVEVTRMKYSGSDFKFSSQANHMSKLIQMKKTYQKEGFHLQRLYSRRKKDQNGIYRTTLDKIMEVDDELL